MFLSGIAGMNRVMERDVAAPYLTLVTGPPGSMKSSFCMTMITNHLSNQGGFGLYCTVEETVPSLTRATQSLGIRLPPNLQITDFTELRKDNQNMDYLKFTRKMIEHFKQKEGSNFRVFVLDSLGAIYSLTTVNEEMRKKMFDFFDFLRTQGLYTFIITERYSGQQAELEGNEGFLADAILNMGLDLRNGQIVRTLQVEKMRHIRHSMETSGPSWSNRSRDYRAVVRLNSLASGFILSATSEVTDRSVPCSRESVPVTINTWFSLMRTRMVIPCSASRLILVNRAPSRCSSALAMIVSTRAAATSGVARIPGRVRTGTPSFPTNVHQATSARSTRSSINRSSIR